MHTPTLLLTLAIEFGILLVQAVVTINQIVSDCRQFIWSCMDAYFGVRP